MLTLTLELVALCLEDLHAHIPIFQDGRQIDKAPLLHCAPSQVLGMGGCFMKTASLQSCTSVA